jgi:hypothetical protein
MPSPQTIGGRWWNVPSFATSKAIQAVNDVQAADIDLANLIDRTIRDLRQLQPSFTGTPLYSTIQATIAGLEREYAATVRKYPA